MAKTKLYQCYDNESESTIGPIVADRRHPGAIRTFYEIIADANTLPGKYPQHFDLRYLGDQETDTGEITPLKRPEIIARGTTWLDAKKAMAARGETGNPVPDSVLMDTQPGQIPLPASSSSYLKPKLIPLDDKPVNDQ